MLIKAFEILLAIAFVVLIYYVVPWVLGMLGLTLPEHIWRVIMVIIGLIAIIGALTGRFEGWWKP